MLIVAVVDRYVTRYWPNAKYTSWYFVGGELDGDKMAPTMASFDRMMKPDCDDRGRYLGGRAVRR
jgi:hypothetical protein